MIVNDQAHLPLIETKLAIPAAPSTLVSRRRLLIRLHEALHDKVIRLTLVSAPAGFGKTTLLSSWARETDAHVGWLSLEEGDNDPMRFLAHLMAAVRRAWPQVNAIAFQDRRTPRRITATHVLTDLINSVAGLFDGGECNPLVLILDDYHVIHAQQVHDALAFLLEHLPAKMHLVLGTRADPPLPIASLRGKRQLLEIRQADLSFSPEEALAFFRETMELDLRTHDIETLNARTEGWAAGLQMAALALRGAHRRGQDLHRLAASFTGGHRYVLDYLSDEVLQAQPQNVQTFLLQTSVLERLCGSLCDAVTARNDGDVMLRKLDDENLFVVPLDEERQWYRYHRLFADLLQARLRQTHTEALHTLHLRAADWHEAHDDLPSAVHHLLTGGARARAADLMEKAAPNMLRRSEVHSLLRWVGMLSPEEMQSRPALTLYAAWGLLLAGKTWQEVAEMLSAQRFEDEPWSSRAGLLSAFDILFHGQFARAEALARRALDRLPENDAFWREMASWILTMALAYPLDAEPVEERLTRVARVAEGGGDVMVAVSSICGVATLRRRQGHLKEAHDVYEQALALARDQHGVLLPVAGQALIGLGSLALEWNELERAAQQLEEGIGLVSHWREMAALRGYIPLSWVRHLQGDDATAYQLLDRVAQLASAFDAVEWDDYYVAMCRARLDVALGNLRAARKWVDSRGVTTPFRADAGDMNDRLRKYEHLVLVRLLLVEECPGDTLNYLDPLLDFARRQKRVSLTIEVQNLRAIALDAVGRESAALQALKDSLISAEPGHYVRIFLDEGAPMARLLYRAIEVGVMPGYAQRLLAALEEPRAFAIASEANNAEQPLVEPLSNRELEVLDLVSRGLTNQEIAERLVISITTVKWHTSNIYGKLGVANRLQAVAKAQILGILSSAP